MGLPSFLTSLTLFAALVLVYGGERIADAGTPRLVTTALGLVLAAVAIGWRVVRWRAAQGERRAVERMLLVLMLAAAGALFLYFAQSDLPTRLGWRTLELAAPRLAGALAALYPALVAVAVLPLALAELSFAAMTLAPVVEAGRVRDAALSGLGLAGVLVFAFSAMFVVTSLDTKWDLSYFRTAKPGEATRKIVNALDEPVQVALFFPPANEVAEQVQAYLDDLTRESPKLEVKRFDQALDPAKARELEVTANGAVVVSRGVRKEKLLLGLELERSRSQLRNFDQEIQKRLLQVGRARKTIYLTGGHGERQEETTSPTDQRSSIGLLRGELKAQNYELRTLTIAEGLGAEVPRDAAAVLVLGPTSPFSPSEIDSLKAYTGRGGRLLVAFDPEASLDFKELMGALGLAFTPQILANDVAYARKSYQVSDRTIIGTAAYSSHPSVTTNGRQGYPMYLMGAGHLDETKHEAELSVDFTVRAHPATWNDLNGNFGFDGPAETRKAWGLAAAITRKPAGSAKPEEEGRAIVLADSDALADEVLQSARGNAFFAVDGLKWLLGDEAIAGNTNAEVDAPIQRSRKSDLFWFYSTIFLAPAAVVLAGYISSRRRARAGSKGGAR
ncbi:MAG: Gldg family protein [Myxococcaceae bacterium]